jgi:hypothetical protein
MAAHPLSLEQAQDAVTRVEQKLRGGHRPPGITGPGLGAIAAAAEQAVADGVVRSSATFVSRVQIAERDHKLVPDWSLYEQPRYQQPVAKFQLLPAPAPAPELTLPTGRPERVLVIPDRHNDPRHPHRLAVSTWIARYGSEQRFRRVVCLGDDITLDSCSKYDRNDTLKGRHKPGIKADLDNHEAMEAAFERGRDPEWKPLKDRCRGNHNQRLWDFENQHPENEGTHTHRYMETLLRFGWRERGFGEIFYINGVGFTHAPFNGLGKPMGGKTATHRAGGLLCRSLIHGHTHSFEVHNAAKLDPMDRVTVVQAGCALPEGEVEHYATHSPTGWSYGVLDVTVQDGQILDLAFVSMRSLRARFSDDGADVRAA